MTTLHPFAALIAACLLSGCQHQPPSQHLSIERRNTASGDAQQFAKILDYYRKAFPNTSFSDGRAIYSVDGPNGGRLHIAVPVAVDAAYQHPYAPTFLAEQWTNTNGLIRMIAGDLLLLKKQRLFSFPSREGYGGGAMVDCITYVVKDE